MAKLVILSEGMTGKSVELKVDKTTIGRVDDNMFPIPEASVSSHHCEILLRGTDVIVHDLNSTNGTFINGQQITAEGVLKPGQILRLGQIELRLEDGEAKSAPAGATSQSRRLPDQTMVIQQGVKLGGEPAARPTSFDQSGFAKKNNKGAKIFIIAAIIFVLILVGVILFFLNQAGHIGGGGSSGQ